MRMKRSRRIETYIYPSVYTYIYICIYGGLLYRVHLVAGNCKGLEVKEGFEMTRKGRSGGNQFFFSNHGALNNDLEFFFTFISR